MFLVKHLFFSEKICVLVKLKAGPGVAAQRSAARKLADVCASELSAAQRGNLLTFVDRSSAQRRSETC